MVGPFLRVPPSLFYNIISSPKHSCLGELFLQKYLQYALQTIDIDISFLYNNHVESLFLLNFWFIINKPKQNLLTQSKKFTFTKLLHLKLCFKELL